MAAVVSTVAATLPVFANAATTSDGVTATAAVTATYVRWEITERRGPANSIQAADLVLFNGASRLPNRSDDGTITVSDVDGNNPGGEGPENAYDGAAGSKWLDFNFSPSDNEGTSGLSALVIQFPEPVSFDSYSWVTANDAEDRDPISWTLAVSGDGVTWTTVDTQSSVSVTTARQTEVGPFLLGGGTGKDFGDATSDLATSGPQMKSDSVRSTEPPRARGYEPSAAPSTTVLTGEPASVPAARCTAATLVEPCARRALSRSPR